MTRLFMLQKSISLSSFSFLVPHPCLHMALSQAHVVTADPGVQVSHDNGEVVARYCVYLYLELSVKGVLDGIFSVISWGVTLDPVSYTHLTLPTSDGV